MPRALAREAEKEDGTGPAADPSRFYASFAVAVLLLSTGAFFPLLEAASAIAQVLWFTAYTVAALAGLNALLRHRPALRLPWALTSFVVLALLSTSWSVAPDVTLRRGIALAGTVAVGLLLAQRLAPLDVFEALRRAALVVALASLLLYAAGDARALDEVHQTLQGVLSTKNLLGRVMAVGLIAAAIVAVLDRRRWRRCMLSAVPVIAALLLTDSAGGMILALLGLAVVGGAALWRLDGGRSAVPAAVLALAGAVGVLLPAGLSAGSLLSVVGRDASLTGRTDIWAQSLLAAAERPLAGAGFGAFWGVGSSEDSAAARRISARLAEPVANAHNGLLDVALDLGMLGVVLAVVIHAALLGRGLRQAKAGSTGLAALSLGVALLVIVSTAAEGSLLRENSLLTLLVAVATGMRLAGPVPVSRAAVGVGPGQGVGPPRRWYWIRS